ncbi:MAG: substrate-binding periplasmic protein [bacterium]
MISSTLRLVFSFFCTVTLLLVHPVSLPAYQEIIYPKSTKPELRQDLRELLRASLEKTLDEYGPYNLHSSERQMNEARYLYEAKKGEKVNVIFTSATADKKESLIPIRIPLRKGILGFRLSLINASLQDEFDRVNSLEELKRFTIGQGRGWGDVELYRRNGFNVITSASFEGLFKMVARNRFDHFPLGINEVHKKYRDWKDQLPELAIEQSIMIYYPWPYYFYVNPDYPEVARRIESGLRTMIQDGTFDEIFMRHHGDVLDRVNFKKRKIFVLKNPLLADTSPLTEDKLWLAEDVLNETLNPESK